MKSHTSPRQTPLSPGFTFEFPGISPPRVGRLSLCLIPFQLLEVSDHENEELKLRAEQFKIHALFRYKKVVILHTSDSGKLWGHVWASVLFPSFITVMESAHRPSKKLRAVRMILLSSILAPGKRDNPPSHWNCGNQICLHVWIDCIYVLSMPP